MAEAEPVVEASATEAAPAEPTPVEEALKDVTTPRKERGNLFDKITAFVLKPKSPRGKKSTEPLEEAKPAEEALPAEVTEPTPEVSFSVCKSCCAG